MSGDIYIYTLFVESGDQLADVFIKFLCRNRLEFISLKLGLCDIYAKSVRNGIIVTKEK